MEKLYQYASKINSILLKIETFFGTICLGALFSIMITNAALRYLFQSGLDWSDELNGFLFVWFSFLSACYIMGTDNHLSITALTDMLPKLPKYILKQCMNVIMIVFSVIYVVSLEQMMSKLPISNVMRVPLQYVYMILPITFIAFVIHIIHNIIKDTYMYQKNRKGC